MQSSSDNYSEFSGNYCITLAAMHSFRGVAICVLQKEIFEYFFWQNTRLAKSNIANAGIKCFGKRLKMGDIIASLTLDYTSVGPGDIHFYVFQQKPYPITNRIWCNHYIP